MTRPSVFALITAALLVPLAAPVAEAAPLTFTINVVSARSLGCSPDLFTSPDLRVRVLVNDVPVLTTEKAQDQDEPVFAAVVQASAELPVTIGVEVEEAEPGGFFFGTTWVSCAVGAGGATRATFTYAGEPVLGRTLRGDGEKAAEAVIVVGTSPPPLPVVTATAGTSSVDLSWPADATGQATGHRVAGGGAGAVLGASSSPTSATVANLCDATSYTFRVIRDTTTWHLSSADVSVTTQNAPPQPPVVLRADRDGNVSFDSPTLHDIARWEVHAGAAAGFTPSDATLRHTVYGSAFTSYTRIDATDVAFRATDEAALVRAVDNGGLRADSGLFTIGAPARGSSGGFASCGAPSVGGASPPPAYEPQRTEPTPQPTPTPLPPPEHERWTPPSYDMPCCYSLNVTIDARSDGIHWPRVVSGQTVNVTLRNDGTLPVRVDLVVNDRFGQAQFEPGPTGIEVAVNATRTLPLAVRAVAGTAPQEGINGEIMARNSEMRSGAPIGWSVNVLIDVPADLAAEPIAQVVDVKFDVNFTPIAAGGRAEAKVLLVNRGAHPVVVEAVLAPAIRNDTDIGRPVIAYGFTATPSATAVTLAPYSKQEVTVYLDAPANATVGEIVSAQLRFRANNSVKVEELRPAFFNLDVQPAAASTKASAGASASARTTALVVGAGVVGAAGVGALWLRRDAARFALAAALYTRLAKNEMLEHPGRDALLARIKEEPGICYSALKSQMGMNTGTIVHHLRALERSGYVTSRKEGSFRRFYPAGAAPATAPALVRALPPLTPTQERVMEILREAPMSQGELAARMGLSQQGINHHVKALERAGHVEAYFDGRVWRYRPAVATGVEA